MHKIIQLWGSEGIYAPSGIDLSQICSKNCPECFQVFQKIASYALSVLLGLQILYTETIQSVNALY